MQQLNKYIALHLKLLSHYKSNLILNLFAVGLQVLANEKRFHGDFRVNNFYCTLHMPNVKAIFAITW